MLVVVWAFSGLYRVFPNEQGVVLRFGKFVSTTQPGLNYHLPFTVERVFTPKVTKVNRIDIGFRAASDSGRTSGVGDVSEESLMLTGDENIVNIEFSVFWVIKDAGKFLFKIQDPQGTVKAAAETAMREVIAKSANIIDDRINENRDKDIKILMDEEKGVGPDYLFSGDKLSKVLTVYKAKEYEHAREKGKKKIKFEKYREQKIWEQTQWIF